MSKDAKKRYKKKITRLVVELYPTDEDIKNRLESRLQANEGKTTYIKRLIREDIERKQSGKS